MSFIRSAWSEQRGDGRTVTVASLIAVAAGIVVIILGVIAGWGQTRLPGAILISAGAAGGGAVIGLSHPVRSEIWARLNRWRAWIALASAVVITLPALIAMGSATFGPLAGRNTSGNTALVAVGVLIGFLFLTGTLLAAILAVVATRDSVVSSSHEDQGQEGST